MSVRFDDKQRATRERIKSRINVFSKDMGISQNILSEYDDFCNPRGNVRSCDFRVTLSNYNSFVEEMNSFERVLDEAWNKNPKMAAMLRLEATEIFREVSDQFIEMYASGEECECGDVYRNEKFWQEAIKESQKGG